MEFLTAVAIVVMTLLFTGLLYLFATMILVSLLVGVVELMVTLERRMREK